MSIASGNLFVFGSSINTPVVSKRKAAKEFRLFKGGRFVKRPYDEIYHRFRIIKIFDFNLSIKKHESF